MLVAIDDTDGPDGGCTTHAATLLLERLGAQALAGRPRLVRLDPDNPWKTRGNAAVAAPLRDACEPGDVLAAAADVLDRVARVGEGKGAGVAVLDEPPDPAWYRRGVAERVGPDEARAALREVPTLARGSGRGLVGCLCAAAWRPGPEATYTRIAYREPGRRGTPRSVDADRARRLQREHPRVFDAYDPAADHAAVAPRTPGPVLLGLRATRPDDLDRQVRALAREPVAHATTFVTNQATDDHLVPATLAPLEATGRPQRLEGGHVRLPAETPRGRERDVMAFEPAGRLREGLLAVEPGDAVLALGSLRDAGRQVNAEKLLHAPADRSAPPACPGCGAAMGSTGADAGYRCRRCGTRAPGETEHPPATWHEADVSARRHLARPLELGLAERVRAALDRADLGPGAARPRVTADLGQP